MRACTLYSVSLCNTNTHAHTNTHTPSLTLRIKEALTFRAEVRDIEEKWALVLVSSPANTSIPSLRLILASAHPQNTSCSSSNGKPSQSSYCALSAVSPSPLAADWSKRGRKRKEGISLKPVYQEVSVHITGISLISKNLRALNCVSESWGNDWFPGQP